MCALPPSLLHILPTLILHATCLRDIERHLGWLRTTIIYVGSGIFGNLLSAIVTPYYPTVGQHTARQDTIRSTCIYVLHSPSLHRRAHMDA